MERVVYIIAIILIAIWIIGFFFYSIGALIHLALLLALVILIIKLMSRSRRRRTPPTDSRIR
ncbi:MAG TPA: lmo0937 family membrane protein [Bacteroidales bacterium]|jgi:membrane protein implicated in regulation of membrane protease activity|nr:lmo0937 family membrane protein [Bacteroidales bacterium]